MGDDRFRLRLTFLIQAQTSRYQVPQPSITFSELKTFTLTSAACTVEVFNRRRRGCSRSMAFRTSEEDRENLRFKFM
jgi:hypothetical protein